MANPSKLKGNAFEKKICDKLTAFTNGKVTFKRSPGSGSIGTLAGIDGLQGDIIRADLKEIPYVECKKYADFRMENFITQTGDEWKWVTQTLTNIKPTRLWLIVFCKDYGRNDWCVTNIPEAFEVEGLISNSKACCPYVITTFDRLFANAKVRERFCYS